MLHILIPALLPYLTRPSGRPLGGKRRCLLSQAAATQYVGRLRALSEASTAGACKREGLRRMRELT